MDAKPPLKYLALCSLICGVGLFALIYILYGLADLGVIDNDGAGGMIMIASIFGIPLLVFLVGMTLIFAIIYVVGKWRG